MLSTMHNAIARIDSEIATLHAAGNMGRQIRRLLARRMALLLAYG